MLKLILPKDHTELSVCGLTKTLEHHFFIISYESMVILCEFTLSEGKKNLKKRCTYMQITLHSTDFSGDKYVTVGFLDACLFGHPV